MRYAVAIVYPLRLYVERDRAVQEIERQDCRVTLSSEQAMRWGGLSMWRELREEEKPAAEVLTALGAAASGDSAAEVLSALAQCVPVRQGFCLPAEEGAAVQLGEEQILLTGFQERLWLAADGRHTLGAILKGMNLSWRSESPEQQELLMENILGLASSELCYFR